jgi:putative ABC transport system permease protein
MTNVSTLAARPRPVAAGMPQILRLALREMRTGLRGFYGFVACVALGVMVITGVGALSDALRLGLEKQGAAILGGDVSLVRPHKRAEESERAWLLGRGHMSETATMRTMARTVEGAEQALVELKAVDAEYPLVGDVKLHDGKSLDGAIRRGGGVAVEPILLERLRLKLGDRLFLGAAEATITAVIEQEPDTIADRLTYGPRVLVSLETLERTGLVQPGSLIRWRYALKLPPSSAGDPAALTKFRDEVRQALPESGFIIADRRDPSPQATNTLARLRQFLTLIGLTALLVGGVGVANAVTTFIDRRRKVIATFKILGATSATIFAVFLTQVMLIAGLGVAIGVALGCMLPLVLDGLYGAALPIRVEMTVTAWSITSASLYGFLVALVFTLWPLGRAELVRAGVLFRDEVAPERVWPRPYIMILTLAAVVALALFAILSSEAQRIAIYFCLAVVAVFAVFWSVGTLVKWAARRVPRPRTPELALAIGNLGGPGGLTRSVVLSLGASLSLLVAVALADASLTRELTTRLPEESPNYFVLNITKADLQAFRDIVHSEAPDARIEEAPMLRGRLVRLKNTPVEEIKIAPEAQWVLTGDRGLTYAETVPEGSRVVAGQWWPSDYDGEPLVSFESDLARHLGLAVGDMVVVNVLGRNVTARIANLREVSWESLAINFVMVFTPNTLRAAPHNLLATVTMAKNASLEAEARVARAISRALPSVTAIRVKDAINSFNAVLRKVMTAVRVAGSVTLAAGALVLAGALATAQRRRVKQAVILKTLGATRRRILASHLAEYVILAAITGLFAVLLGTLAAWVAVDHVMGIEFSFSIPAVLQVFALAIGLVALFGGLGTWQVLRAPAVSYLRSE